MTRKAVVFDVGGVIVRWQPLQLMREHLPMVAAEEAYAQVFQSWGPGADWADFDLGRIEPQALAERIARRTGYPHRAIASLIAGIPEHLQPMAESVALIERVRAAGCRLGLLSNMPHPYATHLEQHHACFAGFDKPVWSGRVGLMKPDRAIFDHVQTTLGLDLDHAIFIDDHAGNIDAARGFGWQALHFENAALAEHGLRALGFL